MRTLLLLSLFPLAAIACTVSANVGDLDRSSDDGGTDAPSAEVPQSDGDTKDAAAPATTDDSASLEAVDGGCGVVMPQYGKFFDIELVTKGNPPFPMGGTLQPGIYALLARRYYYSGDTGTMSVRETLRIRGSSSAGSFERLVEAKNASGSFEAYPAHGESSTFEVQGPALIVTPECPHDDLQTTFQFETAGDGLTLFDNATSEERVYRRVE